MKELTARQKEIWDMRRSKAEGGEGLTHAEVSARLGISVNVVSKTMSVVNKKLGRVGKKDVAEMNRPEEAAMVLDVLTDPLGEQKLTEVAEETGLPLSTLKAMKKRLLVKQGKFIAVTRDLRTAELREVIGNKIHHFMQYIDDKVLAEASARDLAMGVSQLIEKRALLRGEPTAIISDHERAKLHELLPLAIAEAQRRGLTIPGTVTEKVVESS